MKVEQNVAEAIIRMASQLHAVCDGARTKDSSGFSAADVNIGWALAGASPAYLTKEPGMSFAAFRVLTKYYPSQLDIDDFAMVKKYYRGLTNVSESLGLDYDYYTRRLREDGSMKRKQAKDIEFAMSTRKVVYDKAEETFYVSFDKKDFEFRLLLQTMRDMPNRQWKGGDIKAWKVPFYGNSKEVIENLLDMVLMSMGVPLPEEIEDALTNHKYGDGRIGDRFVLDVELGTGAALGRTILKIITPPPWDSDWEHLRSERNYGMEFKETIKNRYGFKWNKEDRYWRGELSVAVIEYIGIWIEPTMEVAWTLTDKAMEAIKNLKVLVDCSNRYEHREGYPNLDTWEATNGWKLREYQKEGVEFIRSKRSSMILDDMGSGKTCQALMSLPVGCRAIAILPASLVPNWEREAALWRPELNVERGDMRQDFCPELGSLTLVSNAKLHDGECWKEGNRHRLISPDANIVLIADECKAFKNPEAKRTHYLAHWVNQVLVAGGRVFGMDGTPITRDPRDLYVQQQVFGLNSICWDSYEQFVSLHGGTFKEGYSRKTKLPTARVTWDVNEPDQEGITFNMQKATIRRNKAELMPWLPPQQWQEVIIDSESINNQMDAQIQREAIGLYGDGEDSLEAREKFIESLVDGHRGSAHAIGVISRLRKLLACSKVEHVSNDAIAYIRSAHFNGNKERLIIMTSSALAAEMTYEKLEGVDGLKPAVVYGRVGQSVRESRIKSFQGDSPNAFNVLVCTIGAAGQGINLTAADTMFFIDWDWSHAMNEQAEARTHRSGLESDKALYVNYIINHWLDDAVAHACGRKKSYHELIKATAVEVKHD